MKDNKKVYYILIFIYLSVAIFTIFPHLGSLPLRTWDESRLAASAYEMYNTKNISIITFDYKPDLWNTKPPLLIWIQSLFISIFGVNTVAVRLPSAICFLFLGLILIWFGRKINQTLIGFYSALIVVCTKGLLYYHCARSADYDSMLIMFTTFYCLLFYLYTINKKQKYLLWFFIILSLATLTKSIQALIPLPFLLIFIIYKKELLLTLKDKKTYRGLIIFIVIISGFYITRELISNGYLKAVYENELGGRFLHTLEGHNGDKLFYYNKLSKTYMPYFFYITPFAFIFNILFIKKRQEKELSIYSFLISIFYFIVINISKTKIDWYALPIIPFLAITIGISFTNIHNFIAKRNNIILKILPFILATIVFYFPFNEILKHNFNDKNSIYYKDYYSRLNIMQDCADGKIKINKICYLNEDNQQDAFFYYYMLQEKGIIVNRKVFSQLEVGDTVQLNDITNINKVENKFNYKEIYFHIQSRILVLTEIKNKEIK